MTTDKLSVSMPPSLKEQVETYAKENHVSESYVVREALKQYLSEPEEGDLWESRIEEKLNEIFTKTDLVNKNVVRHHKIMTGQKSSSE